MFPWNPRLMACLLLATSTLAQETPPSPAPAAPVPAAPAASPSASQPSTPQPSTDQPPNLTVTPPKPKISPLASQPDWSKLSAYDGVLTREEFVSAVTNIYTDASNSPVPWTLGAHDVIIETTPGQKPATITFAEPGGKRASVPRYWRSVQELPLLKPAEPVLTGLRIALDPGHIGGGYAKMEERWLSMNGGAPVMEGSLVLQIALILKPRLEALGALVTMVRSQESPVTTAKVEDLKPVARQVLIDAGVANPKDSYIGIKDEQRVATVQWQAEKLFYRVSEIRARAARVNNELKPDLVLCMHLNAAEWNDPANPTPSAEDHFHLLINGCYAQDELEVEDVRFEMLQRLFTQAHVEEMHLADPMAQSMAQSTGLPPFLYITRNARRVSANPYVYSRNLLANRLYQCPVIYLEPYVMNNQEVYSRLLLGHFIGRTLLGGRLVSSPQEDYVNGILAGLVTYYQQTRRVAQ